ncbi:hypothetical protein K435DRAFT_655956 [Dendrothele bispora CBS 962.96]|uniref:Uncharacterized protein n=1 Tax=Dendrothele bispora (strain CBS 962.96) TaxID=1314807 RepID=A0A4S8MER3_DENBC|nr:hypothetical protein K435DRAFT_655956 [Dendrothele bispora CBS 962.96]
MSSYSIAGAYGSVLIGALVSSMLSGMLSIQCMIYVKNFASDPLHIKAIVSFLYDLLKCLHTIDKSQSGVHSRILDITHSVIIWTGLWEWIVTHFGDMSQIDHIPRQVMKNL